MRTRTVALPINPNTWKGSTVVHRFGGRPKQALFGLAAAILALTSVAPGFAQSAPSASGTWTAGPDAAGANTYVGLVEAPKAGASVASGANLLVTGWAADTTATGWAGFDQMQVFSGARDKGGTKLADGMVGLKRPDVANFLGSNFTNSGFSAVVPAGALQTGPASLYVYLHTPNKGWWYRTVSATQQAAEDLPFPSDPVVAWLRPTSGSIVTNEQFGPVDNYLLEGFALDRNPQKNPNGLPKTNVPNGGAGNVGIASITVYVDKKPGDKGYDPAVNNLGPTSPASVAIGPTSVPLNHNVINNNGCSVFGGPLTFCRGDISVTANYGPNYTFAGWVKYMDQRALQPDMFHTLYATAVSSITGKSNTASVDVYIKSLPADTPPCSTSDFLKHKCAFRAG